MLNDKTCDSKNSDDKFNPIFKIEYSTNIFPPSDGAKGYQFEHMHDRQKAQRDG